MIRLPNIGRLKKLPNESIVSGGFIHRWCQRWKVLKSRDISAKCSFPSDSVTRKFPECDTQLWKGKGRLGQNFSVNWGNSNVFCIYYNRVPFYKDFFFFYSALIHYLIPCWTKFYMDVNLFLINPVCALIKALTFICKRWRFALSDFSKLKRHHMGLRNTIMKEILVYI